ncbi:hypothetical protein QOZ80_9AG0676840 [Eleusine coracana subsp. coracana]|nr:hypothetical protein QOZ80_9AG0676840 [Eleusine coracana subsp. coracana]
MSAEREAARRKKAASEGDVDRLSALPDGPLQTVLSFLPSRDAVRTSVLASRWRNQWKSVPAVRITDVRRYQSADHLNSFVNYFLLFRGPLPVSEMEISGYDDEDTAAAFMFMEQWIRYGLSNGARVLHVRSNNINERWPLPDGLLISRQLVRLELIDLHVETPILDFSSCHALEDLRMKHCAIKIGRIVSPSVMRLCITYCHFNSNDRTRISFPCLTSLILADCYDRTPVLESMPLLASAFIRLQTGLDCCGKKYETGDCGECHGCDGSYTGINSCILDGLSASKSLELTSPQTEFVFRKDLKCCPAFWKLKNLLLSEWCMTERLDALLCFIQHAPALEKLTLQFPKKPFEDIVDDGTIYDVSREPVALEHLTVEVKCHEVDEKISRILHLLECCGVPSTKVNILSPPELIQLQDTEGPVPSTSFSFEQKKALGAMSLDN